MANFDGLQGEAVFNVGPHLRSNSGDTCCAAELQHQVIVLPASFISDTRQRLGAPAICNPRIAPAKRLPPPVGADPIHQREQSGAIHIS